MNALQRSGGIAGIVAGAAYIVQAVMGLVKPQAEVFSSTSDTVIEVVFIIALAATGIFLVRQPWILRQST